MLKADWHSVCGWGKKFDIFVPRKNAVVPVPQAPPRVLALIEAFRKVNEACWQEITSGLRELKEQKPDDILRLGSLRLVDLSRPLAVSWLRCASFDFLRCRLLKMLLEEFEERGFFGAIEAQD